MKKKSSPPPERKTSALGEGLETTKWKDGHDAPIGALNHDSLERGSLARSIYREIKEAPLDFSTRIGLYGEWGTGKTSVLNLIKELAFQQGDIVISLSAWNVKNLNNFLDSLFESIVQALKEKSVKLPWRQRLKLRARKATEGAQVFAGMAGETASKFGNDMGSILTVSAAITDSLMGVVCRRLQLGEREIYALKKLFHEEHRIIVTLDDLDRIDPVALPKLLLSLREIMDFPGFAFILAFDPYIVNRALEEYSKTYAEKKLDPTRQPFLDKIIDIARHLKPLSIEDTKKFAIHQLSSQCDFIPLKYIERAAEWLPPNPRVIKSITRTLRSYKAPAQRHEPDDLAWEAIIIQTTLRKIAPLTATLAESTMLGRDSASKAMAFSDGKKEEAHELFAKAMTASRYTDGTLPHTQLRKMLTKLQSLRNWQSSERIHYEMELSVKEPILTPKEYRLIRDIWQHNFSTLLLQSKLHQFANAATCSAPMVTESLMKYALEDYQNLVEKFDQFKTHLELHNAISKAEKTIDFICDLHQPNMPDTLTPAFNSGFVLKIANIFAGFASREFTINELHLRNRERWLFAKICDTVPGDSQLYYHGKQLLKRLDNGKSTEFSRHIPNTLISAGLAHAVNEAVDLFSTEGGIKLLIFDHNANSKSFAANVLDFLTLPDSPLYGKKHQHKLWPMFTRPPTSDDYLTIADNIFEYVQHLLADIKNGNKFYAAHRSLLEECWEFLIRSRLRKEKGLDWLKYRLVTAAADQTAFKYPAGY